LPPRTLVLTDLAGQRGERRLFEHLSLSLGPGEAAELRGANGAGKTTLLMIVAGIVRAAGGRVEIGGIDPDERAETAIAYLPHRAAIKGRLTVAENLVFWADMMGAARALVEPALETVGLLPIAGLAAGYLSAGQTRRLALARLAVAERPVWLLDEPTAALDSEGEALVARLIDRHLSRGGIVLAATHRDLGLAQAPLVVRLGEESLAR
jgi:heme exporter protein A